MYPKWVKLYNIVYKVKICKTYIIKWVEMNFVQNSYVHCDKTLHIQTLDLVKSFNTCLQCNEF